ncbi:MAG: serine hydrolase domain-containing protein, partial [Cyanobacteria bacterium J06554_3]
GKIDLDAPVSTYLASAPVTWEGITVRHLLTHTAGLSEEVYSQDMGELLSSHGFVAAAGQLPLDFQPGESWMYSNTGYNLLATIVENVSEQSFSTFLETRIFEPVGMDATDVIRDSYRGSNVAMGYVSEGSAIEPIDFNFGFVPEIMTLFRGSGSVTSTVLDLARWAMSLQKGQLLSAETQAEMEQLGLMNSGLAADYGLGWFIRNINGHQIVSHGGNLWGYSTGLSQFPDDKLTIVVLTNKDGEQGEDIALKIAEQYIPELVIDRNGPALSDSNPGLTAQLFAFLQGDAAAIALTPERELSLSTPRGSYRIVQWEQYVSRHQVAALEVIDQAPHPNGLELYYRIQTSDEVHLLRVVVTPDDLIAGMNVRLDD